MKTRQKAYKSFICVFGSVFLVALFFLVASVEAKAATRPSSFKITNPTNNKVYTSPCNITVKYGKAKNVHHYVYCVSDVTHGEGTNNNVYSRTNNKKNNSFTIAKSKLKAGRKYRIYVSAYGNASESTSYKRAASYVQFNVKNATKKVSKKATTKIKVVKPGNFKITNPSSNKKYKGITNVKVKYTSSKNVNHYRVSVSDVTHGEGTDNNIYQRTNNGKKTTFNIAKSKLKVGRKYRVYVSAYGDAKENTDYRTRAESVNFDVTSKGVKPGDFSITEPKKATSYEKPTSVKVKYSNASKVNHYKVSVLDYTFDNFKTYIYSGVNNGTDTTFTIAKSKLKYGHKYRIYVKAYGDKEELNEYTTSADSIYFNVKDRKKKAGNFKITSPTSNKSYASPQSITVKYTSSSYAHHYKYRVYNVNKKKNIYGMINNGLNRSFTIAKSRLNYGTNYEIYVTAYGDSKENGSYKNALVSKFSIGKLVKMSTILSSRGVTYVKLAGAHDDYDGVLGESSRDEIYEGKYYSRPWTYVLRARNNDIAEKLKGSAKYFSKRSNMNIGYSLSVRSSLYYGIINAGGSLSKMYGKRYNADCSGYVSACVKYALWNYDRSTYCPSTSGMRSMLLSTGLFVSYNYNNKMSTLKEGDILLNPGVHTEIVTYAQ